MPTRVTATRANTGIGKARGWMASSTMTAANEEQKVLVE